VGEEEFLYCPIRWILEKNGYFAFVTAGVRRFKDKNCHRGDFPIRLIGRKPDIVGFRWSSEKDVVAVAVECKSGSNVLDAVKKALPQALCYQAFSHMF